MDKQLPYGFTYLGIVEDQFAVFPEHFSPGEVPKGNVGLNYFYEPAQRRILCQAKCRYAHEGGELFAYAAITCSFELDETSWSARLDDTSREVVIGTSLHGHFGAFAVGTLRGYLHARLLPTPIRVILPPIDVTKLVADIEKRIVLEE